MYTEHANENVNFKRDINAGVKTMGMPLALADPGKLLHVEAIRGKDDVKRFLTNLGFVQGAEVVLISEMNGNVIVNVMGTRVAVSKSMATRIIAG